jgi:beta-N-acetylhexosaminidase
VAKRTRLPALFLVVALVLLPFASVPVGAQDDPVLDFISGLSTREKVGQLFLVAFHGPNVDKSTAIAELVQRYRIGGVLLSAERGNIDNSGDAAAQVSELTRRLQALALEGPGGTPTPTVPPNIQREAELLGGRPTVTPTPMYPSNVHPIPLFIAVEQDGDGYPHTDIRAGLTTLPSALSVGATWDVNNAYIVGSIVGSELAALGVNLLLGPSADVLQRIRPATPGDIGVRSFGGDPYWVGEMGQAYIRGVHEGSGGMVLAVAKHFPGLGSSDRKATEEVATVHKSLQELRHMELAPFIALTTPEVEDSAGVADGMMTTPLIRYRGFQGNIRQLTRPIGLDTDGLSALMALPEFQSWREDGLLVSGPLGMPAVRKFYDAQDRSFPHKSVALEALMAGNDLIFVADFALQDDWAVQASNIKDTLEFFAEKYDSDPTFRARVDDALVRIIRLKMSLYEDFTVETVANRPELPEARSAEVGEIARQALTLIYPEAEELADRLSGPPLRDETMLIITDSRTVSECPGCAPFPDVAVDAFGAAVLRLYGPSGSGRVVDDNIHSSSFEVLKGLLDAELAEQELTAEQATLSGWLQEADWIIFLAQDLNVGEYPHSDALRQFLKQRSDWMRNKRLIVFALGMPTFLDTTEVSKLTAYYALYGKTDPFLEAGARALFREFSPEGKPPVDVQAVNYELIVQLEPDPDQVIELARVGASEAGGGRPVGVKAGDTITVRTGVIVDCNGNPVPDGTPVEFRLHYPAESLELPRQTVTTVNGVAVTSIKLERSGELEVSASTSTAGTSTTLVVSIRGDEPATFATIVPPTPTPEPTETVTPPPAPTATPTGASPAGTQAGATAEPDLQGLWEAVMALAEQGLLAWGLAGVAVAGATLNMALGGRVKSPERRLRMTLWSVVFGLAGYCGYLLSGFAGVPGWPPGMTALTVAGVAALVPGLGFLRAGR